MIPVAPGTFGSLWGPPLAWGFQQLPQGVELLLSVLVLVIGVPICGRAARVLGQEDPGSVVFDEIAAFPLVFAAVPVNGPTALLGFAWFRLFDIWKPWPASRLDKLHGGLGIMADDAAAGVYAGIALCLTAWSLGWETRIG